MTRKILFALSVAVIFGLSIWTMNGSIVYAAQAGPDEGLVVFHRADKFKGKGIRFNIEQDGRPIGQLLSGTTLEVPLAPGTYTFTVRAPSLDGIPTTYAAVITGLFKLDSLKHHDPPQRPLVDPEGDAEGDYGQSDDDGMPESRRRPAGALQRPCRTVPLPRLVVAACSGEKDGAAADRIVRHGVVESPRRPAGALQRPARAVPLPCAVKPGTAPAAEKHDAAAGRIISHGVAFSRQRPTGACLRPGRAVPLPRVAQSRAAIVATEEDDSAAGGIVTTSLSLATSVTML